MSPEDYSRSKKVNKVVNWLKQFSPGQFDTEAGGGLAAQLQRGIEDPTPEGAGMGFGGGMGAGFGGGAPATLDVNKLYSDAMGSEEVTGLESEIQAKKTALTEALTNINDNPFYSEATRTGRIAKLEQQAGREIADLTDQLALKQADAQTKINIALKQYDINNQAYQQNLERLNFLISSGALSSASSNDIAQIAMSTGLSTEMIQGIQSTMAQSNMKPTVITNTDNAGNVTVSIVDGNTGNIINSQSLGKVGKANVGKTDTSDKDQETAFYKAVDAGIDQLKTGESWGTVWNRIYARFAGGVPHDVLVTLIDQGLGTEWREGGAYEDYQTSKSGGVNIEL